MIKLGLYIQVLEWKANDGDVRCMRYKKFSYRYIIFKIKSTCMCLVAFQTMILVVGMISDVK